MMKESQKLGLLSSIVRKLNEAGSWTGRMHIHKFVYFAQELLALPSDYDFILYQRGPYSFDLDTEIRSLRSIGAVEIRPRPPYGPSYSSTGLGEVISRLSTVGGETDNRLTALARELGPKQAKELELLATTFYVLRKEHLSGPDVVKRVLSLKPQFLKEQAEEALKEVSGLQERFR
jgi:uncharacterized protein YwgA